jgi:hypothetical protein
LRTVSFARGQPENWGVGEMNSTGRGDFGRRNFLERLLGLFFAGFLRTFCAGSYQVAQQ